MTPGPGQPHRETSQTPEGAEVFKAIDELRVNIDGMYCMIATRSTEDRYDFQPTASVNDKLDFLHTSLTQLTCDMVVIGTLFRDGSNVFIRVSNLLQRSPHRRSEQIHYSYAGCIQGTRAIGRCQISLDEIDPSRYGKRHAARPSSQRIRRDVRSTSLQSV